MKIAAYLTALVILAGCQSMFFYPDTVLRYHPDLTAADPEDVLFTSYDNTTLHGWYIKAKSEPVKGTIFFLHGNAQNMSFHVHSLLWLTNNGYNIFTFDYRGYGISKGEPDIKGVVEDGLSAFDLLASGELTEADNIIVLGQSMGGAVAIDVAAMTKHQDRIAAVITDSAFASWREIYRQKAGNIVVTWPFQYPMSWFINDDYAPDKFINQIPERIKILIIHNKEDKLVPVSHAKRLKEAAADRPADIWLMDYEGHVTVNNYDLFRKMFLAYLDGLFK